jgi:hypothetical protein
MGEVAAPFGLGQYAQGDADVDIMFEKKNSRILCAAVSLQIKTGLDSALASAVSARMKPCVI